MKAVKAVNQITVTGMVLAATPVGEYDRRIVVLTKERGKIAAFARGARKPNSALVGVTSPFSFGEFTVYEGRTSYTLVSASISNYFQELRLDVEGAYYQTMRALVNPRIPNRLIRYIYELKVIAVNGEGPQVFECVCCRSAEQGQVFSVERGGLICGHCREKCTDGRTLLTSTLYTLQYIISSPVEKLYTFVVKEEVLEELGKLVTDYLARYLGKHFKSLEILETIMQ